MAGVARRGDDGTVQVIVASDVTPEAMHHIKVLVAGPIQVAIVRADGKDIADDEDPVDRLANDAP